MSSDILGKETYLEIARFRRALDLTERFAFHVVVVDNKMVLDAAVDELHREIQLLRPRTHREKLAEEAAKSILADLDRVLGKKEGQPLLVDALAVESDDPIWSQVFRQLNSLRNGLERRHRAAFILALTPTGEKVLGKEAPDLWSKRGSGMRLVAESAALEIAVPFLDAAAEEVLPPPSDPATFESLCLDLFRDIWNDPGAQKHGRSGQAVAGVDLFGRFQGKSIGVACTVRAAIRLQDLRQTVERARHFRPPLETFIVATTAPRDAKLQQYARELSATSHLNIQVWSWPDLWHELYRRDQLFRLVLPVYWPKLSQIGKLHKSQRIAPSRLGHGAKMLFGRETDLSRLLEAWKNPKIHVVTLVGWGGAGKTSLVAQFAASLASHDFDGADYFDWSFYSQGTAKGTHATADAFIDSALRFFGDEVMADSGKGPWDKGSRLAELVGARRALLILDGLEPLQHPPGPLAGELKDPAIRALLRGLAQRNAGLCIVTTREMVSDLKSWESGTSPRWTLDRLSTQAGVVLLQSLGVFGSKADLENAVEEIEGHALSLDLLGRFLARAHEGDVRRRDRLAWSQVRQIRGGGHAFRVMAAYENWLETGGEQGARLLTLLRLLGLFDRPAPNELLAVLRTPPPIAGLSAPLQALEELEWNVAIADLEEAGLVARQPGGLDAHPLVREYFAAQLQSDPAWREAHGRLFEYLLKTSELHPEGLAALKPLLQAVYHGCQAGRQAESLAVYRDRILRGGELYLTQKLGAFGADLGIAAHFFEKPWSRVASNLEQDEQAWLLNLVAFDLRALGRLHEAGDPIRAAIDLAVKLENWREAAQFACNLSELLLTQGNIQAAVAEAELAVEFADRSGDTLEQITNLVTLAHAHHQAGDATSSFLRFREAERSQEKAQPQSPLLSLASYRYCDWLLAAAERAAANGSDFHDSVRGALDEVTRRAGQALEVAKQNHWLLDIGLDLLSLGLARFYRAILDARGPEAAAESGDLIEEAVAGLRAAGQLDFLPKGLIARSWLRQIAGDSAGAKADLDEAAEIAERGAMRLYLADVALYRARLTADLAAMAEAKRLVAECGYGRRVAEIADLETRLTSRAH